MTEETLEQFLAAEACQPLGAFQPFARYNDVGDSLTIYMSNEEYVSERVNSLFTVLESAVTPGRPVGLVIKNIRKHFGETGLTAVLLQPDAARIEVRLLVMGALMAVALQRPTPEATQAEPRTPAEPVGDVDERIKPFMFGEIAHTPVEIQNREPLCAT